jgi:hypothetical protein
MQMRRDDRVDLGRRGGCGRHGGLRNSAASIAEFNQ